MNKKSQRSKTVDKVKTSNLPVINKQYRGKSDPKITKNKDWKPKNWLEMWKGIQKLRHQIPAPVDELGSAAVSKSYDKGS